jgi:hypothetical protein
MDASDDSVMRIAFWLDLATAIFAAISAAFWLMSAWGPVPKMAMYWGAAPSNDPFLMAVRASAHWNFWAAVFSALTAVCMAASAFHRMKM